MWRRKIILKRVNLKITSLAQFHSCKFFKNWNQNYILRTFERNSTFECTLPRPFWVTKYFCELKIVKFNRFLCRVTWILQIRPFSTGFQPVFKKPVDSRLTGIFRGFWFSTGFMPSAESVYNRPAPVTALIFMKFSCMIDFASYKTIWNNNIGPENQPIFIWCSWMFLVKKSMNIRTWTYIRTWPWTSVHCTCMITGGK